MKIELAEHPGISMIDVCEFIVIICRLN